MADSWDSIIEQHAPKDDPWASVIEQHANTPPVLGRKLTPEELKQYVRPLPAVATAQTPSVTEQVLGGVGDVAKGAANLVLHPIDSAKGMYQAQVNEAKKIGPLYRAGRTTEAIGHSLATAIPVLGPMAAGMGETAGGVPQMPPQQQVAGEQEAPPQPYRAAAQAAGTFLGPKALKATGPLARAGAETVGNVGAGILGKLTGAGSEAIKTVYKNPSPEAIAAMRGHVQPTDIVNDVKGAVEAAMDKRRSDYLATRQGMEGSSKPVDITNASKVLDEHLKKFRVDRPEAWPDPEGASGNYTPEQIQAMIRGGKMTEQPGGPIQGPSGSPGHLDFSRSPLNPGGQADVVAVTKLVQNWPDKTPLGIDSLIRRVGDYWSDNGQSRAFVQAVKKSLQEDLTRQEPAYGKMVKEYADASQLINDANRELSTSNKNPGVAVRKLTYALNQNNSYRQMLLEGLQQFADKDLKGEIAGQHLNPMMPRGLAGHVGAGALLAYLGHPGSLSYLALTSPRLIGELAAGAGSVKNAVAAVPGKLGIPQTYQQYGPVRVPIIPPNPGATNGQ